MLLNLMANGQIEQTEFILINIIVKLNQTKF